MQHSINLQLDPCSFRLFSVFFSQGLPFWRNKFELPAWTSVITYNAGNYQRERSTGSGTRVYYLIRMLRLLKTTDNEACVPGGLNASNRTSVTLWKDTHTLDDTGYESSRNTRSYLCDDSHQKATFWWTDNSIPATVRICVFFTRVFPSFPKRSNL